MSSDPTDHRAPLHLQPADYLAWARSKAHSCLDAGRAWEAIATMQNALTINPETRAYVFPSTIRMARSLVPRADAPPADYQPLRDWIDAFDVKTPPGTAVS